MEPPIYVTMGRCSVGNTCSTMNCACLSKASSVNLVQPMDWGGTVV